MGMKVYTKSVSSATQSDWIVIDSNAATPITVDVQITGTATVTVQGTTTPNPDKSGVTATAFALSSDLTGITSSTQDTLLGLVTGLRVDVTSHSSGTVTITVVHGDA